MSELSIIAPQTSSSRTTAFTSLLMGVFMHNNQIISITGLSNVTEAEAYKRYGSPFIRSLEVFSTYSTLEQVYVIQSLQRYFFLIVKTLLNLFIRSMHSNFKSKVNLPLSSVM